MNKKTEEEAFDSANVITHRLNDKFGFNNPHLMQWETKTWENLGWHGKSQFGRYPNTLSVISIDDYSSFVAYNDAASFEVGHGITPEEAVQNLYDKMVIRFVELSKKYGTFLSLHEWATRKGE